MSFTASGSFSIADAAWVWLEFIQKYNVRTNSCTCNTSFYSLYYILLNLSIASKCLLKHDNFNQMEGKYPPAFHVFFCLISEDMQYHFQPLDGPFNQEMRPSSLSLSLSLYRHHQCPQNGWQLLEIPGCVTTLRCTCCAIYVPPVLMPQQPERQRRIMPTTAQAANSCCSLVLNQG